MEKERTAQLEVEDYLSKGISLYDQSQQKVSEFLKIDVSKHTHTYGQALSIKNVNSRKC